uniref:Cytochrome b6-f complex subunit PetP n=1 Tax=Wrangelia sp. TaxID=2575620 RepID=A0A4D6WZW7_9FLOR|nr:cytochrome b6-f complex subunit PetP [Wrangelia sp.]
MTNQFVQIKTIPTKFKFRIMKYIHKHGEIVGQIKYLYNQKIIQINLIEFSNYSRIWIMPNEIKQL